MRDGQKRAFRCEGYDVARYHIRLKLLSYLRDPLLSKDSKETLEFLLGFIGTEMVNYKGSPFAKVATEMPTGRQVQSSKQEPESSPVEQSPVEKQSEPDLALAVAQTRSVGYLE